MPRQDPLQSLLAHLSAGTHGIAFFDPASAIRLRSAPGRLDVLGGLGADAGGTLAHLLLRATAAVAVQIRHSPDACFHSDQIRPPVGEPELRLPADAPPADAHWAAGLLAAWQALRAPNDQRGVAVMIHSDIPMNAGQASSTALLAAFVAAAADLLDRPLDANAQAEIIRTGEAALHGSAHATEGAIIDALTCLLAGDPSAAAGPALLRYNAQPHQLVGAVPLPPEVKVLALDTGVRYTSANATLDELRVAGAMARRLIEVIYRDLGQPHTPLHGYLANTSPLLYRQYFRTLLPKRMRAADFVRTFGPLPESLGPGDPAAFYRVRTAADHLIAEHEHAEQFLQAMEELAADNPDDPARPADGLSERQRTLQRAGRLLLASHHSYRLRLELSCREADWLVDKLMEAGPENGIFGARITGCGGGGTVMVLLDRTPRASDVILDVIRGYAQVTGLSLGVTEGGGPGATGARLTQGATITPTAG